MRSLLLTVEQFDHIHTALMMYDNRREDRLPDDVLAREERLDILRKLGHILQPTAPVLEVTP